MNIQPLSEGHYYHIYNRGINSEDIFKEENNYSFFLEQYKKYCFGIFDTFAYALMKNHFHLLVFVKENVWTPRHDGGGDIKLNASKQLSHFFNSYAQTINKRYDRTDPLFESPFERKLIEDDNYLTSMVYYCHYNAQLHGIVNDFRDWPHSSYHRIENGDNSIVCTQKILTWFGGTEAFIKQHEATYRDGGLYINVERSTEPDRGRKVFI
ncbi:MAG: hypothetical protein WKF88_11490 [Ferruginibacter sp.]